LNTQLRVIPGQLGVIPGQLGVIPGQLGVIPGQLGVIPGQLGVIPGGLTSQLQPMDISINKPFKAFMCESGPNGWRH
jgi:hypothetical protein